MVSGDQTLLDLESFLHLGGATWSSYLITGMIVKSMRAI